MRSISSKLEEYKSRYESLRDVQASVIKSIKKELTVDRYYIDHKDKFRHALCLFFGEYVEKYSMRRLPNRLDMRTARTWDNENKYQVSLNYYRLEEEWGDIFNKNTNDVGFICERKYLHEAISDNTIEKIWKYKVNEKRYTESLITFKEELTTGKMDLYDTYVEYLQENKKHYTIDIIHKPSLNIKNIVLYLTID